MQVTRVAPDRPVPSLMHRRRVMADRITYVGLDIHKESIVVAVASGGLRGEVREVRPDREHSDGAGPSAAQAWRRGNDPAVLLRGGAVRNRVIVPRGGASEPSNTLLPGKVGGTVAVRRTLASTIR